ncbi:MAG: hypothetical protein PSX36_00665 [bacterium]|nr:hypothetical protein [bacterium]
MKKLLASISICLIGLEAAAQAPLKNLEGRWESTGKKTDSSLTYKGGTVIKQVATFNSDRSFRREIYVRESPKNRLDTFRLNGNYKTDFKRNTVFFRSDLDEADRPGKTITPASYTSRVQFLSDSSMVLLDNVFYRKRRIEGNPLAKNNEPGSKNFYLQNVNKPGKSVRVRKDNVVLLINESKRKGDHISRFNTTICILAGLKKDSVIVRMVNEEIEIEYRDHVTTSSNNYFQDLMNRKYKSVALNDIYYVNMKSPGRNAMAGIGRVIMGVSILAMLASPLVALSVPAAEQTQTRESIFFAGLTGLVVAVPFFVIGKNKKYGISKSYQTKSKNYWQIKER